MLFAIFQGLNQNTLSVCSKIGHSTVHGTSILSSKNWQPSSIKMLLSSTHSILTSEFLFYILSSEQSAYFLQFVQLEVQTYAFLCPLLQHEEKRMCTLSSLSN